MKTLTALFFLPALTNGLFLATAMAADSRPLPSLNSRLKWPKWNHPKASKNPGQPENQPLEPLSYHSLMVNGARYYTAKNYALALANYRQALSLRPDDATALSGEAWSLYYLGLGDQAAKDFQTLLKFNANDSWAREGISLCRTGSNPACA